MTVACQHGNMDEGLCCLIAPEFPGSYEPSGKCRKEEVEVGTNSSTVTLGGTLALMWCDHKTWLIQAHYADTSAAFVRGKKCPS